MRLRNHLLAFAILVGFLALGTLYVRWWVVKRPFGVILFVSDGLVSRHLAAARLYEGGADHQLAIEQLFAHAAQVRNDAAQFAVPDAAAAASAIATGQRVRNHTLAVDATGKPLVSLLELARENGRAVGLITTGRLTEPTAAAFYAHAPVDTDHRALATSLLAAKKFDVLFGGGGDAFAAAGEKPDLLAPLTAPQWDIIHTRADLENATAYRDGTLLGVFAPGPLAFSRQREAGSSEPALADLVRRAIQCLQTNRHGYVLIVDEALTAHAAILNESEHLLRETLELDRAIETAARFAGEKSLIVAVGRHSTGGFALNGFPLRQDKGLGLLGTTPDGHPTMTWASGPHGPQSPEPSAFQTTAAQNTAEDVLGFARGIGAEKMHGFLHQRDIFQLLKEAL